MYRPLAPSVRVLSLCMIASFVPLLCADRTSAQEAAVPRFVPDTPASTGLFVAPDGSLQADGARYRARFDAGGARLRVASPVDPRTEVQLSLRLCDWGRGGHRRAVRPAAAERAEQDGVRYVHDGIVERYRITPDGIEQSFVLHRRPAGHGDLVIAIAAAGDGLQADARPAAHQALEFRHHGAGSVRYGEAVAFERGGSPVACATRYDGAGRIELVVPGDLLDAAEYPVIVDPAVGPVFNPGGPSFNDSQPDVAFQYTTDHYLVVWTRTFVSGNTDLRGQLYDADGTPVGGLLALSGDGVSRRPAVVSVIGASFLVVYESGDRIRCQLFGAQTGNANSPVVDVTAPGPGVRDRRPSVSAPQAGIVTAQIVWDRTGAGANEPTEIVTRLLYTTSALVVGPETVLESVTNGGIVQNARLAQNIVLRTVGGSPALESRAVWERFYPSPAPGDFDLRTATFRTYFGSFTLLSGPATLAGAGGIGPNERAPSLALRASTPTNPVDEQYLIAWDEDGDIKAHRYDLAGPIGTEIDVRSTSDLETEPAVGAGYCEFTVGYLQAVPPNEFSLNVRAARVLLDGTVAVADRAVDVLNGPFQSGLRAASRPVEPSSLRRLNTVLLAWSGATGPAGTGLNDVRARFFEPVAPFTSPFGSACPGPLGELPTIGTAGGSAIPGNGQFEVTVDDAPANALAVLIVSDQFSTTPIPGAPGCFLYAGLPFVSVLPTVIDPSGRGAVDVPMPCPIPSGVALAFQWGVWTPAWNAFGWIVSDDLDISWSHF